MSKIKVDFYKEFKLPPTTCGLVNKITSPKGTRKFNENGFYEYHLKTELVQIYHGKDQEQATVDPGIYWVMDIYKNKDEQLIWNHYLIVVEESDNQDILIYAVAEFLNAIDSSWITKAIPYIKRYYKREELEAIEIEPYRTPKKTKKKWGV